MAGRDLDGAELAAADHSPDGAFAVAELLRHLRQRQQPTFVDERGHLLTGSSASGAENACVPQCMRQSPALPRLLSSKLHLHDIDDVEAHIVATIQRGKHRYLLERDEVEDVVSHCLLAVWRSSTRLDSSRGSFSTLAVVVTSRAVVDYLRKTRGRTKWSFADGHVHERPLPVLESLDDRRERGLEELVAAGAGDPQNGCDPDLGRLYGARDCGRARDLAVLGLGPS